MAVLLVAATAATAQDRDYGRETLRGLNGLRVLIGDLKPDAERDGLQKTTIQTDVELKLRLAGIKVLTQTETMAAPGRPCLHIRVATLSPEPGPGLYAYFIEASLLQQVRLERNPSTTFGAVTWFTTSRIGTVGSSNLATIRDAIKEEVDVFINAYLSVNPK
jgi:hypothetical protein